MNLLTRIIERIAPCGHQPVIDRATRELEDRADTIAQLHAELEREREEAKSEREQAKRRLDRELDLMFGDVNTARDLAQAAYSERDLVKREATALAVRLKHLEVELETVANSATTALQETRADLHRSHEDYEKLTEIHQYAKEKIVELEAALDAADRLHREQRAEYDALEERHQKLTAEFHEYRTAAEWRISALEDELGPEHAGSVQEELIMIAEGGGEVPTADEDELVDDITSEFVYQIRGMFFEGRNHWVLSRGDETVKAPIHDKEWLALMAKREVTFAAGDALRAVFRIITYRAPGGRIFATHSVEKVLGIIAPAVQLSLPEEVSHAN